MIFLHFKPVVPKKEKACLISSIILTVYHELIGFQAINHGMASSFLDKVREVTKEFFALPMEEKQKYSRTLEDIEGYGNDTVVTEHQTLDWTDRLYLLVRPEDQRKLKLWPENPDTFR